jgi:predicted nuclease of predicted toxin-antitoxin system
VRSFVDENLSPTLTGTAHDRSYDATSSRDRALLGLPDHALLRLCVDEERVLVTENAGDFRALCAAAGVHPGLIVMPSSAGARQRELLAACLDHIGVAAAAAGQTAGDYMLNRVVEIAADRTIRDVPLPL